MRPNDLNEISEWEYIEMVDGLMMKETEQRDNNEKLIDYIADFFSQAIVVDMAGKVRKSKVPKVEDVKKGLFETTKSREEKALKEYEEKHKTKEEVEKEKENKKNEIRKEQAKLKEAFGIK